MCLCDSFLLVPAAFKNILGDTILIDDLESATSYRRAVSDTS